MDLEIVMASTHKPQVLPSFDEMVKMAERDPEAVSYTHLTLPTSTTV